MKEKVIIYCNLIPWLKRVVFIMFCPTENVFVLPIVRILIAILFLQNFVAAQDSEKLIIFEPSKNTFEVINEDIIDFTIKLKNQTQNNIQGKIKIEIPNSFELVSKNAILISLHAGDSTFIPIKIFVKKHATSGMVHLINISLHMDNQSEISTEPLKVQVAERKSVSLYALLSNILLDPTMDSIAIPVRVVNRGNTIQKITLVNRFPSMFNASAFHESIEFFVFPAKDTLLTFRRKVLKKMLSSDGFEVHITGLYDNGDVFGMSNIRVQSTQNDRKYSDESNNSIHNLNTLTFSSQNLFNWNQSYSLRGRGALGLPKGNLGYSVDMTTWKGEYSPTMLRNTYISYRNEQLGLTFGNINRNMELMLNGRGVIASVTDTSSNNTYEVGVLDGNTNLLGNNKNYLFPMSRSGWGAFTHTDKDWELASFAVYSENPLLNSRSALVGNSLSINNFKQFRIIGAINTGYSKSYDRDEKGKPSFAGNLNISGTINKFLISSQNYYSSAYYPGQRKGAISLAERITWLTGSANLWASFEYNLYAPKTMAAFQTFLPVYSSTRTEIGVSGTPFKHLFLSFTPKHIFETNNSYKFIDLPNKVLSMDSWNINNGINYLISNKQYVSINSELGLFTSSLNPQKQFHLRSNLNLKLGSFNLSSTLQLGSIYLSDVANNNWDDSGPLKMINVTPSIQHDFFRNKLHVHSGITFISNSRYGTSLFLNGRSDFDMTPRTNLYIAYNRNQFLGITYSFVETGLTWKLTTPKLGQKSANLEVFLFKDLNQNGVFDIGDSEAVGHLYYINSVAMTTDNNGLSKYKKLPYGKYRITINSKNGWFAPEQYIQLDQKNQRLNIALGQSGTLEGILSYNFAEFSYDIVQNLQGITITAIDKNKVSYKTKTNPDGQYVLNLPNGSYAVSVDATSLSKEVVPEIVNDLVQVHPDTPTTVDIQLFVKNRKVESKKFVSPNIFLKR